MTSIGNGVRVALLVGWTVLALAALLPPSMPVPVSVHVQAAIFVLLVAVLVVVAVLEPQRFTWTVSMSLHLRMCLVLMVVASSMFRGRIDYGYFVAGLLISIALGIAVGLSLRTSRTLGENRDNEL